MLEQNKASWSENKARQYLKGVSAIVSLELRDLGAGMPYWPGESPAEFT